MKTQTRTYLFTAFLIAATFAPGVAGAQSAIPGPCTAGLLPGGARSLLCVPIAEWNGELVVFAH